MIARSQRLRFVDIRGVFELAGRALEAGQEPDTWRAVTLIGLCRLIGGNVGLSADLINALPGLVPQPIDPLDVGWTDIATRERFFEYLTSGEMREDPGSVALLAVHQRVRFATWTRRQHIDDTTWYASPSVSVARRSGDVDDFVCSTIALRPGVLSGFVLYRPCAAKPFGRRECRIVRLLHVRLLRLMDFEPKPGVDSKDDPHLSPRLRQTLDGLLTGKSIKQIGHSLDISPHTVGDYVKAIYQKFDVCSRGELLSRYHGRKRPLALRLPSGLQHALHAGD